MFDVEALIKRANRNAAAYRYAARMRDVLKFAVTRLMLHVLHVSSVFRDNFALNTNKVSRGARGQFFPSFVPTTPCLARFC